MTRVNADIFRQAMLLLSLIVLPSAAPADAGHDARKAPVPMEGMDHDKTEMNGQAGTAATGAHWMAPAEAARRANPVAADSASHGGHRHAH